MWYTRLHCSSAYVRRRTFSRLIARTVYTARFWDRNFCTTSVGVKKHITENQCGDITHYKSRCICGRHTEPSMITRPINSCIQSIYPLLINRLKIKCQIVVELTFHAYSPSQPSYNMYNAFEIRSTHSFC